MRTIYFEGDVVRMIDQTLLPGAVEIHTCADVACLIEAIQSLRVRGAPALGVAGAYGMVLSALAHKEVGFSAFCEAVSRDASALASARPTAVNLQWGVGEQMRVLERCTSAAEAVLALRESAESMARTDIENNKAIGLHGAGLIASGDGVLTHCNAGALACVGYGTALGVIRAAHEQGKGIHVYMDETRPLCQGSRLTAWEMVQENIPATLITDNMAGHLMSRGLVQKIVVGADRITASGDVANKIGTYSLAVLAHYHKIPMIVAAPTSTIDFGMADGAMIPIEQRPPDEVIWWQGAQNAPVEVDVYNPAFDVTPAALVSAIVTEKGVARPPYDRSLSAFKP